MSDAPTVQVTGLYVGLPNAIRSESTSSLIVDWDGILGDRHIGMTRYSGKRERKDYDLKTEIRNNRQFSAVSPEELTAIAHALGVEGIEPEWLGANLLLAGLPNLSQITPLTRLFFEGGVVLTIFAENIPCRPAGEEINRHLAQVSPTSFPKAAMGRRGVVGWIERPGRLEVGETAHIKPPTGAS